ncbi:hypothetical protein GGR54DRAFT_615194 [Hypoxylon sp. NC1633]|nr:hypothetical protein GGR54DRAFT_615194 [Hypoxylon sp. NC1633]
MQSEGLKRDCRVSYSTTAAFKSISFKEPSDSAIPGSKDFPNDGLTDVESVTRTYRQPKCSDKSAPKLFGRYVRHAPPSSRHPVDHQVPRKEVTRGHVWGARPVRRYLVLPARQSRESRQGSRPPIRVSARRPIDSATRLRSQAARKSGSARGIFAYLGSQPASRNLVRSQPHARRSLGMLRSATVVLMKSLSTWVGTVGRYRI